MELNKQGTGRKFITILSDGKLHQTVSEDAFGAIVREYEDKDGNKKTKHELVFDDVSGKITRISLEEGEFGTNLNLEFDNDGVVSVGTESSFGEDLMKKLPAINLAEEVKLIPYSFDSEKGKKIKGVSVYQGEIKVGNYYFDFDKKVSKNGLPEPEGDTDEYTKEDWKMYFMKVRKFLKEETKKLATKVEIPF